jgi:hypothetical protein
MVTDEQVRLLRRKLLKNHTKEAAAAAAGMSVRSAQKWQSGALPSESKKPRQWRTRKDPLAGVWDTLVVPLLEADEDRVLQATTVLDILEEREPGKYGPPHLRTLQRRICDWRALHGSDKEVFFEQKHVPGREAAMDFTHCSELQVTIAGKPFDHLLFQFMLSFSKWRWVCVAHGETFEALVFGLQGALWELGAAPAVARTDNLSAATHELKGAGRPLTKRFKDVLDHYGLRSTRIRPGKSNENGVVEKGNHVLKSALRQALLVRGSKEFETIADYEEFISGVVNKLNRRFAGKLDEERSSLRPLPANPVPNYSKYDVVVRKWSTVRVGGRAYSVPSRLIGSSVEVRVHPDEIEVRYKGKTTAMMPRLRGEQAYRIDYRHIIWSLIRKPGAFARYKYREELFPTATFRLAYDAIHRVRGDRADIEYVRILHLAASTMESRVDLALAALLDDEAPLDYATVKALAAPAETTVPHVHIGEPDLSVFNDLLVEGAR